MGYKGRYLLEGPEKLKYLTQQLGEQIAHIKGKGAAFAPHWAAPDSIANAITKQCAYSNSTLYTTVLAVTGFSNAKMQRIFHVLFLHLLNQKAYRANHNNGI